jgi:hypothetical protein
MLIVSIDDAMKTLEQLAEAKDDRPTGIRTLAATPTCHGTTTSYKYEYCFINKINKKPIQFVKPEVKYWYITFKFSTEKTIRVLVPGFVKFYSINSMSFVPVEFMKKSDLLVDTAERMVQVVAKEEVNGSEELEIGKDEYYNIIVNSNNDNYMMQFYFNDILSCITYNNYDFDTNNKSKE